MPSLNRSARTLSLLLASCLVITSAGAAVAAPASDERHPAAATNGATPGHEIAPGRAGHVVITATGFAAGTLVAIRLACRPEQLPAQRASADGVVRFRLRVPDSLPPGRYRLILSGQGRSTGPDASGGNLTVDVPRVAFVALRVGHRRGVAGPLPTC